MEIAMKDFLGAVGLESLDASDKPVGDGLGKVVVRTGNWGTEFTISHRLVRDGRENENCAIRGRVDGGEVTVEEVAYDVTRGNPDSRFEIESPPRRAVDAVTAAFHMALSGNISIGTPENSGRRIHARQTGTSSPAPI